ncbi:MAG: UvrB/UvrC motif-containing protein [Tissierellia bacterium]|nr:UvrB/UvrC motif-containing protein [Tissierellia bacterium]
MKCDRCNKEALVEIHIIENEEQITRSFCKEHYLEFLEENKTLDETDQMNQLQRLLRSLFSGYVQDEVNNEKYEDVICDHCQQNFQEVLAKEEFGCDRCYENFGEHTADLLLKLQGDLHYRGKFPKSRLGIKRDMDEVREKKEKLQRAIEKENFEYAAILRDEIKDLEKRIGEDSYV